MAETTYHEATAHEATALPVMLPGKLVGRDKTLAAVYAELKQNKAVLLYGGPGVGKTAIAATLASAYTQQPGGALWLSTDADTLSALIVRVGRSFGDMDIANSDNPTGMVGAAATLLAQHKPLVVLDGNPMMPAAREFINKLAPNLPVMIVTGARADGPWAQVEVPPLADDDATTLFTEKSGIATPEAGQIAAELDQNALALLVAAGTARIAKLEAPALISALQNSPEDSAPRKALNVGFASLQPALQGILLMLGATFEGKASLEMVTRLSGAATDTVEKVMNILSASGFVQKDMRYGAPFYYLHPTAHAYAESFLASSGRLKPLRDKVRDTVLAYANDHSSANAHDKLSVEMDAFLATAHWASEQGESDVSSQIVVSLTQAGDFVKGRGYLSELLQLQDSGSSGTSAFPANATLPPEATPLPGIDEDDDDPFADTEAFEENTLAAPEDIVPPTPSLDESDPDSLRIGVMEA
ncbi:MAG: AAA family ATPase, partial [Chloroflexota bacterium]